MTRARPASTRPKDSRNSRRSAASASCATSASIAAETIAYGDFVACGGEQGARDAGKMRLEGAEYVVQDGDVMHFRFNV